MGPVAGLSLPGNIPSDFGSVGWTGAVGGKGLQETEGPLVASVRGRLLMCRLSHPS